MCTKIITISDKYIWTVPGLYSVHLMRSANIQSTKTHHQHIKVLKNHNVIVLFCRIHNDSVFIVKVKIFFKHFVKVSIKFKIFYWSLSLWLRIDLDYNLTIISLILKTNASRISFNFQDLSFLIVLIWQFMYKCMRAPPGVSTWCPPGVCFIVQQNYTWRLVGAPSSGSSALWCVQELQLLWWKINTQSLIKFGSNF